MAALGAGGQATHVSLGLVAYVVMEMKRHAQGEAAAAPVAGSTGNTIGQVDDALKKEWQDKLAALLVACQARKCKLEEDGTVHMPPSRNLGTWRQLARTIDKEH